MPADVQIPVKELNSFDLPAVCLVTGDRQDVVFKPVKFLWYPRWVPALILFPWGGLLLALIVSLALRKSAKGELPFTARGWSLWKRAQWVWGGSLVLFFVGLFGALFALAASSASPGWESVVVIAALAAIASPIAGWFLARKHLVHVRKIDAAHLTLGIPSADAALRLREHLFPVRAMPVAMAEPVQAEVVARR